MSKYGELWKYVSGKDGDELSLSFDEIERIAGVPLDHSFLNYKKELSDYGFKVKKISIKNRLVIFSRR